MLPVLVPVSSCTLTPAIRYHSGSFSLAFLFTISWNRSRSLVVKETRKKSVNFQLKHVINTSKRFDPALKSKYHNCWLKLCLKRAYVCSQPILVFTITMETRNFNRIPAPSGISYHRIQILCCQRSVLLCHIYVYKSYIVRKLYYRRPICHVVRAFVCSTAHNKLVNSGE